MSINTTLTQWQSTAACRASHAAKCSIGHVWYQTGLFSLVITTRMIRNVQWCLNSATINCFYSTLFKPIISSALRHKLEEQSRNGFKQLNLFCWPKREKRLCLPVPHNVTGAQEQGQLCLFVSLGRSWLGTKVHKWGAWDTGKSEAALPPEVPCADKGTFCSSQLCSQHTKYAHRQRRRAVPPSARNQAFLPSLWPHRGFILPFWAAELQCSELWLALGARAELQCTNHLLGLEQLSGPACPQLSAEILCETSSLELLQFLWQTKLK